MFPETCWWGTGLKRIEQTSQASGPLSTVLVTASAQGFDARPLNRTRRNRPFSGVSEKLPLLCR